ncbi:MAG TPA: Sll0314/Alr1548 family TPR repeat-containing protein [Leptolyngbyaceae cyanobacterium]
MVLPSFKFARPAQRFQRWFAGTLAVTLSLSSLPAFAADPFRSSSPHSIGDASEAAFVAMFQEGDYVEARQLINTALASEPNEPMTQAMAASMAYLDQNWNELERRAKLTQEKSQNLMASDPLRGNLYMAVGIFLEGGHVLQTEGLTRGTPTALRMLQQVFSHLGNAEKIDRNDPELSLLKGFMDLLLAVNLPFSNPDQAIARLRNAAPTYLANRGIAIGLRDLGRYDEALKEVDIALSAAPDNPELIYLKGQITRLKGDNAASLPYYNKAMQYADQMPRPVVRDMRFEQCLAEGIDGPTCSARAGG